MACLWLEEGEFSTAVEGSFCTKISPASKNRLAHTRACLYLPPVDSFGDDCSVHGQQAAGVVEKSRDGEHQVIDRLIPG